MKTKQNLKAEIKSGYDTTSLSLSLAWRFNGHLNFLFVSPRERAAGRAGPETDNLGDGAKRELLGQVGAPTLGEQWGETQEHILQVIYIPPMWLQTVL